MPSTGPSLIFDCNECNPPGPCGSLPNIVYVTFSGISIVDCLTDIVNFSNWNTNSAGNPNRTFALIGGLGPATGTVYGSSTSGILVCSDPLNYYDTLLANAYTVSLACVADLWTVTMATSGYYWFTTTIPLATTAPIPNGNTSFGPIGAGGPPWNLGKGGFATLSL